MDLLQKIKSVFNKPTTTPATPVVEDKPVQRAPKKGDNIIEIKGITKVFDGVTVIDNISLGPSNVTNWPLLIPRLMLSITVTPSNTFVMPLISIMLSPFFGAR